jgi:hypothetical protein
VPYKIYTQNVHTHIHRHTVPEKADEQQSGTSSSSANSLPRVKKLITIREPSAKQKSVWEKGRKEEDDDEKYYIPPLLFGNYDVFYLH